MCLPFWKREYPRPHHSLYNVILILTGSFYFCEIYLLSFHFGPTCYWLLQQGYRYHKLIKTFTKVYKRYKGLIQKDGYKVDFWNDKGYHIIRSIKTLLTNKKKTSLESQRFGKTHPQVRRCSKDINNCFCLYKY